MKSICEKYQPYTHFVEKGKTDKVEEKKSVLYYLALNDICRIKFDKGINKNNEIKKCDYIVSSEKALYLIELKGENIDDLIQQSLDTIEYIRKNLEQLLKNKKLFVAILVTPKISDIPRDMNSKFRILAKKLYSMSQLQPKEKEIYFKNFLSTIKVVKNISKATDAERLIWNWDKTNCSSNNPIELD